MKRTCAWPAFVATACAAVIVAACGDSDRDGAANTESVPILDESHLRPETVHVDTLPREDIFGSVQSVALMGEHLWVVDRRGQPSLHVIDTATGRLVASLGRSGHGPGEFDRALKVFVRNPSDSHGWVWDGGLNRMSKVSSEMVRGGNVAGTTEVRLQVMVSSLSAIGREQFLGVNPISLDSFFVFFSPQGRITRVAPLVFPGSDTLTIFAIHDAYNGTSLCTGVGSALFVTASRKDGSVTLYDSTGRLRRRFDVPFPGSITFERKAPSGRLAARKGRDYYTGCSMSRTHVYALFSGIDQRLVEPGSSVESHHIHVFNLRGNLVKVLYLDAPMTNLTVDPSGRRLFGTSWTKSLIFSAILPSVR